LIGVKIDELPYRRHLRGGGLVADTSYVKDDITVPYHVTVGPDTHVVSDRGMAGQSYIWGNLRNPNEVSRVIDDEGRERRCQQRLVGVVARLLEIEQLLAGRQ
jgi:hypothetical protein